MFIETKSGMLKYVKWHSVVFSNFNQSFEATCILTIENHEGHFTYILKQLAMVLLLQLHAMG